MWHINKGGTTLIFLLIIISSLLIGTTAFSAEQDLEPENSNNITESSVAKSDNKLIWNLDNGMEIIFQNEVEGTDLNDIQIELEQKTLLNSQSEIEEYIYSAKVYQNVQKNTSSNHNLAEYRLIERRFENLGLDNGRIFFVEIESNDEVNLTIELDSNFDQFDKHHRVDNFVEHNNGISLMGDSYHYYKWDDFKNLLNSHSLIENDRQDSDLTENDPWAKNTFDLEDREGIDFFIAHIDKKSFDDFTNTCIETLDTSINYHNNLEWYTRAGSFRQTPISYLDNRIDKQIPGKTHNVNLQSTVPLSISDHSHVVDNELFDMIAADSAYNIMQSMDSDGFFKTEAKADYLNNTYGIQEDFIDTRMSADASILLVNSGLQFNLPHWVDAGTNYLNYFKKMQKQNIYHNIDENSILFPDYYHPEQHENIVPVASLNHTVHNINYLFHLLSADDYISETNEDLIPKEKVLNQLELMLSGLADSGENWVKESGDLYYGYSEEQGFYSDDYPFITYRDLKVLQSNLEEMNTLNSHLDINHVRNTVDMLFDKKHQFLQEHYSHNFGNIYEDNLSDNNIKELLTQNYFFSSPEPRYGRGFLSLPVDIEWKDNPEYYALGRYIWLTGAEKIKVPYDFDHKELNPEEVYLLKLTRDDGIVKVQ